jgi:hypothetical protein
MPRFDHRVGNRGCQSRHPERLALVYVNVNCRRATCPSMIAAWRLRNVIRSGDRR